MKDVIYITGHKNPDSDSICAAISYADFKNKTGKTPAIPVRLGEVNQETQFILDYFGVEKPMFLETVKTKVEDLEYDKVTPVLTGQSLKDAWIVMKNNNLKSIPVTNKHNHLLGVLSTANLTSSYMDIWDNCILAKSSTPIENIVSTLDGEALYIDENATFPGKIVVAAMQPDTMKDFVNEGDIAIVGDRYESQEALIDIKASLIIVTGSHKIDPVLLEKAKEKGVSVITTPHDSFSASRLIVQSIPVDYVMAKENLVTFSQDELVDDIKGVMTETRFRSYPILDSNNKVTGLISRYHLIANPKKKVIQVDHNERGQSVDGLEEAEILEIIDHHRVADIQTGNPIYFRNEPLGSTSTIVAKRFFENSLVPSKEIAGLLCGAIISDTLLFRSPTCTSIDKEICLKLAKIAEIDVNEFATEMFKAGTSLKGKTVEQIFNQDFKPFTIEGIKIGVAQVNTMDIEGFMPLKEEMLTYMDKKADEGGFQMMVLLLTDILKEGSQVLVTGLRSEIAELAFKIKLQDKTAYLPGVLSRKKQVIPPLTQTITNM